MITIPIIPLALVATIAAGPARGEPGDLYTPLMNTEGGTSRVIFLDGYVTDWSFADATSATLDPGTIVEVRGGRCWLDGGPVTVSHLLLPAVCVA